ncbi:MAG: hypothetical protein EOM23_08420 [Candidatus Moranbacteria bacterium]|nr:hypothetical protein [Candidatus Moranbacteria bacterium]
MKKSGMMISTRFIEVHMNLSYLKEKCQAILDGYDLKVYSIRTKREFGEKIIEILIDTETMDINLLEKIHMSFLESIPEDTIPDDYFLELSSVGAERPLESIEDLEKAIGKYIYFEAHHMKSYGTLLGLDNDIIKIEINDKGRIKIIEVKFDDARKLRTAIKF